MRVKVSDHAHLRGWSKKVKFFSFVFFGVFLTHNKEGCFGLLGFLGFCF